MTTGTTERLTHRRGRRPICTCEEPDFSGRTVATGTPFCIRCGGVAKSEKKEFMPLERATEPTTEPIEPAPSAPAEAEPTETPAEIIDRGWRPGADVFLNLRGKLYLPARRRVQWMRGEPEPHPDWSIDTEIITHERGRFLRPGHVEGGYAVVRATVHNTDGRLIACGMKSEYSENFADYLEKAETGAIARALAVAGYGTESALDFDEGLDKERIADSPVAPSTGRPIEITPATAPPVGRGGTPVNATIAQIKKISMLSSHLGLGTEGLSNVICDQLLDGIIPDEWLTPPTAPELVKWMEEQSATSLGRLIVALELARDAVGT
jgi:hypothetical protein